MTRTTVGTVKKSAQASKRTYERKFPTVTADQFDLPAVVVALKKNPRFLQAMKVLAGRQRAHSSSAFHKFRRDLNSTYGTEAYSYEDIAEFFKMLQSAGIGDLHVYKDADPEFAWNLYYLDFAKDMVKLASGSGSVKGALPEAYRASELRPKPAPRLLTPTAPVIAALEAQAAPIATSAAVSSDGAGTILVNIRGMEFELDLSKVPADLLKFRRIL